MYTRLLFLCFVFKLVCGDNIAQRLIDRYNDVAKKCIDKYNKTKPANECSGIILRCLNNIGGAQRKYAWSKKESNIRKNAFSAAFLRRDQLIGGFPDGYESGFIYYPHLKTPSNKYSYQVYCTFPIDAYTDFRGGRHGCGKYHKDTSGGGANCDALRITSIAQWTAHYQDVLKSNEENLFRIYQCSFDMTNREKAPNSFALSLEAKKYLQTTSQKFELYHNEIVIRAWNQNYPEKLPIEAFFYLIGYSEARKKAFMYQSDYLKLTGETIPVVGITLPTADDVNLYVILDDLKTI